MAGFGVSLCPGSRHLCTPLRRALRWRAYSTLHEPIGLENVQRYEFQVEGSFTSKERTRLDAYLASHLPGTSRARLIACIKAGGVELNGRDCQKPASIVQPGDRIICELRPPPASRALPEDIPLVITYEDDHLMVVNKPAGLVVHPCPSQPGGTLVNALLHHCGLGPVVLGPDLTARSALMSNESGLDDDDDDDDGHSINGLVDGVLSHSQRRAAGQSGRGVIRPGIVHRLDKGTTGLLVVAKTEETRIGLVHQFAGRTVERLYLSLTLGMPSTQRGRIVSNIGRDLTNRTRMASFPPASRHGRRAESTWAVVQKIAGGLAALTRWKLGTGRTHQIRVHAKELACPLLGDDTYGGGPRAISAAVARGSVNGIVNKIDRPMLHAATLGFKHPVRREWMRFEAPLPADFEAVLQELVALDPEKGDPNTPDISVSRFT